MARTLGVRDRGAAHEGMRGSTMVKPQAGGGPTLEQVAAVAGVSRATVSRVINDSPRVSERVRRTVESAIETLGYVPNRAARTLVTRRTDSVALVVVDSASRVFSEPFFAGIVRGVSAALAASDRQLVLLMTHGDDRERLQRYLMGGYVDGAMLLSMDDDDPLPARLSRRGVPVVLGGRPPDGLPVSCVDADNAGGAAAATAHLVGQGRTRIATITGPVGMRAGRDRLCGYRDALKAAGLAPHPSLEAQGDFTQAGGGHAMRVLLAGRPDLDAVFAASDLMAAGALEVLREAGRRVPGDVALIGFDDSIVAASAHLSSVHQPVERMGREMVRLLTGHLDGTSATPQQVILPTTLALRATT